MYAAFVLIAADRFALADGFLADALDDARRRASPSRSWPRRRCARCPPTARARWTTAEAEARAAVLSAREHGWEEGFPLGDRVPRRRARRPRPARGGARGAGGRHRRRGERRARCVEQLLVARGRLALASGDLRAGVDDLLAAGRAARSAAARWAPPARRPSAPTRRRPLAALGEHDAARRLADEELELARAWGAPRGLGMALHAARPRRGRRRWARPAARGRRDARRRPPRGSSTRGRCSRSARRCAAPAIPPEARDPLRARGAARARVRAPPRWPSAPRTSSPPPARGA